MTVRLLVAALIACCSAGCVVNSSARESAEHAEILYIPLPMTTYTAVTLDNIGIEGSCSLTASARQFQWLSQLETRPGQEFDGLNVRAKIRLGPTDYYVDSNGVVLTPNGQIALSASEKADLVGSLESLRKASSCNQYDWLDD